MYLLRSIMVYHGFTRPEAYGTIIYHGRIRLVILHGQRWGGRKGHLTTPPIKQWSCTEAVDKEMHRDCWRLYDSSCGIRTDV